MHRWDVLQLLLCTSKTIVPIAVFTSSVIRWMEWLHLFIMIFVIWHCNSLLPVHVWLNIDWWICCSFFLSINCPPICQLVNSNTWNRCIAFVLSRKPHFHCSACDTRVSPARSDTLQVSRSIRGVRLHCYSCLPSHLVGF